MNKGKKYKSSKALLEKEVYELGEGLEVLVKTSQTKFDSSCEVHLNLKIDPKHADQQMRSTVNLPNGTGKKVKIVAFCEESDVKAALASGAIKAGNEDLIDEVSKGFLGFDVAVATPPMMKKLGKIAKTLGQKGLMPNPKSGTVTPDLDKAIAELQKGKVEFRNDKQGNLHNMFGKVSFGEDKLKENILAYLKAILDAKPTGVKGTFVNSVTLATTMGPGVRLDVKSLLDQLK